MAADVTESRKEEGCLRFDLLKGDAGKYHFYEIYKDSEAAAHHKTLPHYLGCACAFCGGADNSRSTIEFTFNDASPGGRAFKNTLACPRSTGPNMARTRRAS